MRDFAPLPVAVSSRALRYRILFGLRRIGESDALRIEFQCDDARPAVATFEHVNVGLSLVCLVRLVCKEIAREPQNYVRCISHRTVAPNIIQVRRGAFEHVGRQLSQMREKNKAEIQALS